MDKRTDRSGLDRDSLTDHWAFVSLCRAPVLSVAIQLLGVRLNHSASILVASMTDQRAWALAAKLLPHHAFRLDAESKVIPLVSRRALGALELLSLVLQKSPADAKGADSKSESKADAKGEAKGDGKSRALRPVLLVSGHGGTQGAGGSKRFRFFQTVTLPVPVVQSTGCV